MYEPKLPPDVTDPELQKVIDWAKEELSAIALEGAALNSLELRTIHAAPDKPREGMIVEADGTNWNPGAGAGQYSFRGGVWKKQFGTGDTFTLAANITDEGSLAYLNELPLSDMADILTKRVIGRGTAGTGIPEALSIETVLDWLGSTRGQVLRRGATTWETLALGAAGLALISDGTDIVFGATKWITDLQTNATTSGATTSFTDINSSYKHLTFFFDRVSGTANNVFQAEFDDDNTFASLLTADGTRVQFTSGATTVSYTSDTTPAIASANASGPLTGWCILLNYSDTSTYKVFLMFSAGETGTSVANLAIYVIKSTVLVDNVRFGFLTGTLDNGQIIMGGIK